MRKKQRPYYRKEKYDSERYRYIIYFSDDRTKKVMEDSYGKYTKDFIELCIELDTLIHNYFIINGDTIVVKVYSELFGYNDILMDLEDLDIVMSCRKMYVDKSGSGKLYAKSGRDTKVHRMVYPDSKEIVHIGPNKLDNRRRNIRPTSHFINMNNIEPEPTETGIVGVRDEGIHYRVVWVDHKTRLRKSKAFNKSKYGKDSTYMKAIKLRYKILTSSKIYHRPNELTILRKALGIREVKIQKRW